MLEDLDSAGEIMRLTDQLLRRADGYDRFPTPVGDVLAATNLTEPEHSILSSQMIAQAPKHLRAALRRVSGKAHALLDRREREVHVNPETDLAGQRAFKRLHEVSHDLFEWQHIDDGVHVEGFADDQLTLSPATHILFEREANQGAAELLFQRDRFQKIAAEYSVGVAVVEELAVKFGSSRHAAFRRYVETHGRPIAGVVLDPGPTNRKPLTFRRREVMCSKAWRERFEDPAFWPKDLHADPYGFVEQARRCHAFGPPDGEWTWPDRNLQPVKLRIAAFSNSYRTFVLIWVPARHAFKHRRVLAA
jgi:hypothetical protein